MTSDATAPAIRLQDLGKRYGRTAALRGVTLDVASGETVGFLGLNGAGKTTTLRILLDLVRPTTGTASVFGFDCQAQAREVRARVGYLPGELGFHDDMTGRAHLTLLARLEARPVDPARQRALIDRLDLGVHLERRVRDYSTGMKRKLGLLLALQSDAPLLVLDEPTEGLDPVMQAEVHGLIASATRAGRTVFFSSHVLGDVERVCDRIALLRDGELALAATLGEVRRMAPRQVTVSFAADVLAPARGWPDGVRPLACSPRRWELAVQGGLGPLIPDIAANPVLDVEVREPRLEDVLASYYAPPDRPRQASSPVQPV